MTDSPHDAPEEKKIIVDEDWKSQAQAEKEELERHKHEEPAAASPDQQEPETAMPPMPPASLAFLVSSLGMQAMIALGLMPDPTTGKPEVHLDQAKHFIDTVAMLDEKTEGNRTPEESAMLGDLLHELRMGYVAVQSAVQSQEAKA
jgi:hypothetical protein